MRLAMPEHVPEICPQCQSPLSPQDAECWNCGRRLEASREPEREAAGATIGDGPATTKAEQAQSAGGGRIASLLERLRRLVSRS